MAAAFSGAVSLYRSRAGHANVDEANRVLMIRSAVQKNQLGVLAAGTRLKKSCPG